ncbi:MAG: flagellar biosynthesis protein FliQ [Firmicutes bacterium]|nr:flagellar biosynthesis protein FliQ [Bacillota bacterium]
MTEVTVISLGKDAITTVLLVAGPVLGFGMLVGLIVSIFQATTQIQEQTLTFIPKIIAVLVSLILFGPWMLRVLIDFGTRLLSNLEHFIS